MNSDHRNNLNNKMPDGTPRIAPEDPRIQARVEPAVDAPLELAPDQDDDEQRDYGWRWSSSS